MLRHADQSMEKGLQFEISKKGRLQSACDVCEVPQNQGRACRVRTCASLHNGMQPSWDSSQLQVAITGGFIQLVAV